MKQGKTIQDRLKDIRTERHLKLEKLAAVTEISKSDLEIYKNDNYKEISHKSLLRSVHGLPSLPDREPEPSEYGTYGIAFE